MIEADVATARNMLRMLVQSGLAKDRSRRREARIRWTINGIVAPVTESLAGGHPDEQSLVHDGQPESSLGYLVFKSTVPAG